MADATLAAAAPSGTDRRRWQASAPLYLGAVIAVVMAVFTLLRPGVFLTVPNLANIATDASLLLVMAVGMTFVIVTAGIDLSVGSVLVLSSVVAAKVMSWPDAEGATIVVAGLLAALASGFVVGVINGLLVALARIPALIVTLGTLLAALGTARLVTNGADIRSVPEALTALNDRVVLRLPWIVFIALLVAVVGGVVLRCHRFGRHTFLIGSDAEASRLAGLSVQRHVVHVYILSGTLAGLSGFLSLARFATTTISGHPTDNLQVIAGVVLGGTSLFGGMGSMTGSVLGVLLPSILQNGLVIADVTPFWQPIVVGVILIAAVYVDQLRRGRVRAG